MESILRLISVPAIFYKGKEAEVIANAKAKQLLKDNDVWEKASEKILKSISGKNVTGPFYDVCRISGDEYFMCIYPAPEEDGHLVIMQELNGLKDFLGEILPAGEAKNELDGILEATYDDFVITDGQGVILRVCPATFEKFYGVSSEEVVGRNVFAMEEEGIFRPSVIAEAIRKDRRITMVQENKFNCQIVTTAVPIRDNKKKIRKVISFSHDITEFFKIKEQYEELEKKITLYTAELEELRSKDINFFNIIGKSKELHEVLKLINKVADYDANVLLCGESGVGKTLFARSIHSRSKRSDGPLIEVNCGAIPENLLESELFGYESGAFTGARREGKIGLIELAQNGTLFLDEISELPLNLQVKLLKVIQDKTITRVGGTKTIKVDFRLITATNRDLKALTEQKSFREDLFYRLNVITINVPPLRERRDDIFPLSLHFVKIFNNKYHLNKVLAPSTIDRLISYDWPGNIRELENVIERALLTSEHKTVTEEFLPENIRFSQKTAYGAENWNFDQAMENYEREIILKAYDKYKTSVGVAKALGISQSKALRKIRKYVHK